MDYEDLYTSPVKKKSLLITINLFSVASSLNFIYHLNDNFCGGTQKKAMIITSICLVFFMTFYIRHLNKVSQKNINWGIFYLRTSFLILTGALISFIMIVGQINMYYSFQNTLLTNCLTTYGIFYCMTLYGSFDLFVIFTLGYLGNRFYKFMTKIETPLNYQKEINRDSYGLNTLQLIKRYHLAKFLLDELINKCNLLEKVELLEIEKNLLKKECLGGKLISTDDNFEQDLMKRSKEISFEEQFKDLMPRYSPSQSERHFHERYGDSDFSQSIDKFDFPLNIEEESKNDTKEVSNIDLNLDDVFTPSDMEKRIKTSQKQSDIIVERESSEKRLKDHMDKYRKSREQIEQQMSNYDLNSSKLIYKDTQKQPKQLIFDLQEIKEIMKEQEGSPRRVTQFYDIQDTDSYPMKEQLMKSNKDVNVQSKNELSDRRKNLLNFRKSMNMVKGVDDFQQVFQQENQQDEFMKNFEQIFEQAPKNEEKNENLIDQEQKKEEDDRKSKMMELIKKSAKQQSQDTSIFDVNEELQMLPIQEESKNYQKVQKKQQVIIEDQIQKKQNSFKNLDSLKKIINNQYSKEECIQQLQSIRDEVKRQEQLQKKKEEEQIKVQQVEIVPKEQSPVRSKNRIMMSSGKKKVKQIPVKKQLQEDFENNYKGKEKENVKQILNFKTEFNQLMGRLKLLHEDCNKQRQQQFNEHKLLEDMENLSNVKKIILQKFFILNNFILESDFSQRSNIIIKNSTEKMIDQIEEKQRLSAKPISMNLSKLFEQYFPIKLQRIQISQNNKQIEQMFLYKNQLVIAIKRSIKQDQVNSIELYFIQNRTFKIGNDNSDSLKKQMSDLILKFFQERNDSNEEQSTKSTLDYICQIFDSFEEVFICLNFLQNKNMIRNVKLSDSSQICFSTVLKKMVFLEINFILSTDYYFNWALQTQNRELEKILRNNQKIEKICKNIKNFALTEFNTDQSVVKKIKKIITDIQKFGLNNPNGDD